MDKNEVLLNSYETTLKRNTRLSLSSHLRMKKTRVGCKKTGWTNLLIYTV